MLATKLSSCIQSIVYNHLMESITDGFVSREDSNFFMYAVKDLDDDRITCYCFRTCTSSRKQKRMTVRFRHLFM